MTVPGSPAARSRGGAASAGGVPAGSATGCAAARETTPSAGGVPAGPATGCAAARETTPSAGGVPAGSATGCAAARATVPRLVVAGDPRHGVARYAALLADATPGAEVLRIEDVRAVRAALAGGGPAHLHVTDRLWGRSPEEAADRVCAIAAAVPVTVTLHDLPAAGEPRRAAAYARVVAAARGVTVCSHHEAARMTDHLPAGPSASTSALHAVRAHRRAAAVLAGRPTAPEPRVIAHALPPVAAPATRPVPGADVAVLGFVYPGKGHEAVIDAAAALPVPRPPVVALGGPSPGHEDDVAALRRRARAHGVRLDVTGHVPDAALVDRLRRAGVPVAAHRTVSASGSIATWIAAGRRPLVLDGPYARELAALRPGAVTLVAPDGLPAAIAAARRDPDTTWWAPDADLGPTLDDTVHEHVRWWRSLPW